jgi:drug/metabolite transporter (DMT)-like permease
MNLGLMGLREPGVIAALSAALLFGAATPLAKGLLGSAQPWLLAGLLYCGSGLGMTLLRALRRTSPVTLPRGDWPWLVGAVLCGGVLAPVLLMFGLHGMPASGASLLLNAEGVFTALLAWFAFRENFDRRIALGMLAILAGALVLSWPHEVDITSIWPALAVLGACLAWGLDNNLTRKVALNDATWIAAAKGLSAGSVNLALALLLDTSLPSPGVIGASLLLGFLSYGLSLSLFVLALRNLGTARTGAYFSVAPFFGALLALSMGEPLTPSLVIAGILMAVGIWLHLAERHEHEHTHLPLEHEHEHVHDEHHQHAHEQEQEQADGRSHRHRHRHELLTHRHPHFPDGHHDHRH